MILAGRFCGSKQCFGRGQRCDPGQAEGAKEFVQVIALWTLPWPRSRDRLGTAHRNYGLAVRTEAISKRQERHFDRHSGRRTN